MLAEVHGPRMDTDVIRYLGPERLVHPACPSLVSFCSWSVSFLVRAMGSRYLQ